MVNPQWGSFQTSQDMNPQNQMQPDNSQIEEEAQGEVKDEMEPKGEKPQWGNFENPMTFQGEEDPTEGENTIDYLVRNITMNASRLGEQFLGRYGNMEKMGKDILVNLPKHAGMLGWAISELVGEKNWEKIVRGDGHQTFPTSEDFKKVTSQLSKGYTEPKTPGEKKFQEYTEDVGGTLSGRRPLTARNVLVNNLGIPAAANAVKQTVEGLGFGEDKATAGKLGVWTALSLIGNINGKQFASNLMNAGRNGVPNNLNIDVPRFQQKLGQITQSKNLLFSDPRSALARQQIDAIARDLQNGQTSVKSAMNMYDGVNAAKRNHQMFQMNRTDQNFARKAIDEVRNAVKEEIMASSQAYPEAMKSWNNGIQAWAVIHQSDWMKNWVENVAKGPYAKVMTGPAAGLFGIGAYGGVKAPIIAVPSAAAVPAIYKVVQTGYRVWNSKPLAHYYWNAVRDAQRENLPSFINNYNKLNEGLKKQEKSVPATPKRKSKK